MKRIQVRTVDKQIADLQLSVFSSSTSHGMVSISVETTSWTIAMYPSLYYSTASEKFSEMGNIESISQLNASASVATHEFTFTFILQSLFVQ